jgi:AcrR family transcriptional regulator
MKTKRAYVMRARAESAGATRQRILDAAVDALWERRLTEVRLEDIATRAEVTVQTVLRIFGSKPELVELAWGALRDRIMRQRDSAEPGDIDATVRALYDHYEAVGDFVIRNLADEQIDPALEEGLERGRREHRRSMQRQFGPLFATHTPKQRKLVLDCLVAACDVYTWKLLRRDLCRTRQEAEACVRRMVSGILKGE